MIKVYVNDLMKEISECSLENLLNDLGMYDKKGIAVALNQTVVRKEDHKNILLKDNDKILIISVAQGG